MLLAMQLGGSLYRGPIEDRNMIRSITCEHLRLKSIKPHTSYSAEAKMTMTTRLSSKGTLASAQEKSMIKYLKGSRESPFLWFHIIDAHL